MDKPTGADSVHESDIAIIAMNCRVPGADDVETFWENLRDGVESISSFSDEELLASGVPPELAAHPDYVKRRGVLSDVESFDAAFFGVSPADAQTMDPQQRLFLECAWESLERAGCDPETFDGAIGVYAGAGISSYLFNNILAGGDGVGSAFQAMISNDKDFLPAMASYKLNLKGPSVCVQSACSTSLVAVHLACQSLIQCECDMALAGGVGVHVPQKEGYLYEEGMVHSPDGRCRAFDAEAMGTVGGSGVGVVVLKRLADALADGNAVHAVVKGSAINNDGSLKAGFTAPGVDGQAEVIAEAQAVADVDPGTVACIEAHGTGTRLGDPIEIAALTRAFRYGTRAKEYCAVGSVKTNIGHLDCAAGVVSLIKAVLSLENRMIPPSLHFDRPNPEIDFAESPFYVNTKLSPWKSNGVPRRAGVSSFGLGGSNAHVVLEEAPGGRTGAATSGSIAPAAETQDGPPPGRWRPLFLSAKTESALETMTDNLVRRFKEDPDLDLADAAFTLMAGRKAFPHGRMVVCRSARDAAEALETRDPGRVVTRVRPSGERGAVFMFPGLGEQYVDMTRGLLRTEPVFRGMVDRCSEILAPLLGADIREIIFRGEGEEEERSPGPTFDFRRMLDADPDKEDAASRRLNRTRFAHPAVFVVERALAEWWMHIGIRPRAMIGYSLGEYVAASLAGVFSLEDALRTVVRRAELIDELPEGLMLAVPLPEDTLSEMLGEEVSLAAVNARNLCVAAGPAGAVAALEEALMEREIVSRRLRTTHAFHSTMMAPMEDAFIAFLKTIRLSPPEIPYISNASGAWITDAEAADPARWAAHTRRTIRFSRGIGVLLENPETALLEVGPGRGLCGFALQHPAHDAHPLAASVRNRNEHQADSRVLLHALGELRLGGVAVDPDALFQGPRRRVSLPTYPFERRRCWMEPDPARRTEPWEAREGRPAEEEGESPARLPFRDFFNIPAWKRTPAPRASWNGRRRWLVFIDESGLGSRLVEALRQKEQEVVVVARGEGFSNDGETRFTLRIGRGEDYQRLFSELKAAGRLPRHILYTWSVTPPREEKSAESRRRRFGEAMDAAFLGPLHLARGVDDAGIVDPVGLCMVTNNVQAVTAEEIRFPETSLIIGPCKVIPREHPNIACGVIDLDIPDHREADYERAAGQVLSECLAGFSGRMSAWRGPRRWVRTFERIPVEPPSMEERGPREGGVHLITGGLGGVGLGIARHLVEKVGAVPVLMGRTGLPPAEEREDYLATHDAGDMTCDRIRKVRALEASGREILVIEGDVADIADVRAARDRILAHHGRIDGVIHAAGVPGGGLIRFKTRDAAEKVLAPKVLGALVLDEVFRETPLDFMAYFSSGAAIMGELGQVDYCAANAFLDAHAHYRVFRRGRTTVSVNWDAWRWDAWQKSLMKDFPDLYEHMKRVRETYGLGLEEGAEALMRALDSGEAQIIVSTRDFNRVIANHEATKPRSPSLEEITAPAQSESAHPRPDLGVPYQPPENETEEQIVGIFQELLGIEPVGIHDHFFQLGGHSLLGIQLIARLRKAFDVDVPLKALFNAPTPMALTGVIEEMILMELEALTDEEIEALADEETAERAPGESPAPDLGAERALPVATVELPNGMVIQHLNKAETDHFYKDIFEDRVYYRNGIRLNKGDVVLDVGANIGLFTLFAHDVCEDLTIYSFEPAPPLFEILRANTARYGVNGKLFNCGLSNQAGEARFTFYPGSSGMSSFHADREEEMAVLKGIMTNQRRMGMEGMDQVFEHMDDLLRERFREREYTSELRRLSDVIEEEGIDDVALLKIDVQKCELEVLEGIDEKDWPRIRQVVIEAHDVDGRVNRIGGMLEARGRRVAVEQDPLYEGTNIYNIYGVS